MSQELPAKQKRRKELLQTAVHKYIKACKHIFDNSTLIEGKAKADWLSAYDDLKKYLDYSKDAPVEEYSNVVLRMGKELETLLPHPNNNQYTSKLNCLDIINGLCLVAKI